MIVGVGLQGEVEDPDWARESQLQHLGHQEFDSRGSESTIFDELGKSDSALVGNSLLVRVWFDRSRYWHHLLG